MPDKKKTHLSMWPHSACLSLKTTGNNGQQLPHTVWTGYHICGNLKHCVRGQRYKNKIYSGKSMQMWMWDAGMDFHIRNTRITLNSCVSDNTGNILFLSCMYWFLVHLCAHDFCWCWFLVVQPMHVLWSKYHFHKLGYVLCKSSS
jgi:hypothetical protein